MPTLLTKFSAPLLAIGLALAAPATAQERTAISGTTVSLSPLKGFAPSAKFAGLENAQSKASLLVVEMPAEAHPQLSQLFGDLDTAKARFAAQNIKLDDAQDLDTGSGKARLLTGKQELGPTSFDKWILLAKGAKTVMITVQAPKEAGLAGSDVVAMLKSVSLGAEPSLDEKLGALPFRIKAAEPFRVVDTFGGLGVLMTVGPADSDPKGQQPMLVASYQTGGQVTQAQLAATGERLLKSTRGFEQAEVSQRGTTAFAGSKEAAMLSGTVSENGTRKRFVQYIGLGAEGRFVRMIVSAEEASFPKLEPAIKSIADSVAFAK
jgi:hypothetical protein